MNDCDHLIIGGFGLIGTALREEMAARGLNFMYTRRSSRPDSSGIVFDLEEPTKRLPSCGTAYLVAARQGFAACEGSAPAWHMNVDSIIALGLRFRAQRPPAFVVFISSDAVEWAGGTAYARQKAQVEAFLAGDPNAAVVRPTRVGDRARDLARVLISVGIGRVAGLTRWS
jgi:hypothetical protein